MARSIPHASRFLEKSEPLCGLLREIARGEALLRAVRGALPPPVDAHCLNAALHQGSLTLVTDSPLWASRIRFFAPDLLRVLAAGGERAQEVRVRVQPRSGTPEPRAADRPRLAAATVEHLLQAAAGTDDPALANALRRLARAGAER